jgi:hypothetical protein
MIGVGIVGCNYGRTVLIPAFRHDPRCEVVALAGTDAARTAGLARAANVARGFGGWQAIGRGTYHRGRDRGTAENPAECTQASGGACKRTIAARERINGAERIERTCVLR